ncbi:MAG: ATP-dependent Clp protease ATP-binding subunit, partial [Oscillospiraceae bacterium]|nr:ATP-dependent Clp protease ATP-binding subunit [Oscillospiraceae bacterium]
MVYIGREENGKVINEGLCIQCAKELGIPQVSSMLDQLGIGDDELEMMNQQMQSFAEAMEGGYDGEELDEGDEDFEMGGAQELPALQNIFNSLMNPGKNSPENAESADNSEKEAFHNKKAKDKDKKKYKFLDAHCENLCNKAREGRIDNIVGRQREIERVMQILNRRSKNNPCLIGEPGVGKTAVVEGIAQRLASGNVPAMLQGKELFLLDLT